jgi:nuclear pore complex protein Nup98-Nup96
MLNSMHARDLAYVPHFSIGRVGFGFIDFLEPVDLTGLRLDELVFIERGFVQYSSKDRRPKGCSGINRAARISLYGCFPSAALQRNPRAYLQQLRELTARWGGVFEGYDAERGEWRFRVDRLDRLLR